MAETKPRDRTWRPGPGVPRILLDQPRWFPKLRQLSGARRLEVVTRHARAVLRAAGHPWGWEDPGPPRARKSKGCERGVYAPDGDDFRPMCANCDKIKMVPSGEDDVG